MLGVSGAILTDSIPWSAQDAGVTRSATWPKRQTRPYLLCNADSMFHVLIDESNTQRIMLMKINTGFVLIVFSRVFVLFVDWYRLCIVRIQKTDPLLSDQEI